MEELAIMGMNNNEINIQSVFKAFIAGGQGPGSYYTPVLVQFVFIFPLIYFIVDKMKFCYDIILLKYFSCMSF